MPSSESIFSSSKVLSMLIASPAGVCVLAITASARAVSSLDIECG